jgi:hypothetical protein
MTTDAGSGFDNQAAGRDAGDDRLEEESRHVLGEDAGADALEEESRHLPGEDAGDGALEEERERRQSRENVNDAF